MFQPDESGDGRAERIHVLNLLARRDLRRDAIESLVDKFVRVRLGTSAPSNELTDPHTQFFILCRIIVEPFEKELE